MESELLYLFSIVAIAAVAAAAPAAAALFEKIENARSERTKTRLIERALDYDFARDSIAGKETTEYYKHD